MPRGEESSIPLSHRVFSMIMSSGMWSPGGTLESRLSLIYPLDAPAVSPSTSHLWTKANRMIVGSIVKVVAAAT